MIFEQQRKRQYHKWIDAPWYIKTLCKLGVHTWKQHVVPSNISIIQFCKFCKKAKNSTDRDLMRKDKELIVSFALDSKAGQKALAQALATPLVCGLNGYIGTGNESPDRLGDHYGYNEL